MSEPITAYKGFNEDMTCRGFQYAEGETYEHDGPIELCRSGFHAVRAPLDVFAYYPPASSVYRQVVLEDVAAEEGGDSKVTARKLTVGAKVNLVGLAQAHVEYVRENVDTSKKQTKVGGTASNTGNQSVASNTGYQSAASNTGNQSAASNTGNQSVASNTGDQSAASNTGDRSAASVTGKDSVAIVTGKDSKAAGSKGCWIVLTERDDQWRIVEVRAVKVDGKTIKADVFYELVGGKVRAHADQTAVTR